jgi:predicted ATPase/DNA-binding CsgD family transcriptional regulator
VAPPAYRGVCSGQGFVLFESAAPPQFAQLSAKVQQQTTRGGGSVDPRLDSLRNLPRGKRRRRRERMPLEAFPRPLSRCLGREVELAELQRWYQAPPERLVNLCGPGGIGKTRLALEFAAHLSDGDEPPAVVFVSLGSCASDQDIRLPIGSALRIADCEAPQFMTRLSGLFSSPWLLILDSFEHLTEQSPFLTQLLQSVPQLKILVTSRSHLRVAGEKILAIPPLALDSVQGGAAPAIELFLERARLLRPDLLLDADGLSIVEGICRSLEGLPLALELAASRLELLSLSEIQSRLSKKLALLAEGPTDVAPRHRTIRAAMDWSYELLGPVDRLVFRWLSPFASGVQLGDLTRFGWSGLTESQLLESVGRLVRQNLLMRSESQRQTRIRFMEVLREYANDRLETAGEVDEAQEAFCALMLGLAQASQQDCNGQQAKSFAILSSEHINLLNSLGWLCQKRDARAAQLVSSLGWYWESSGYLAEGRRWAERCLGFCEESLRWEVLLVAATLARHQGDYSAAENYYGEAKQAALQSNPSPNSLAQAMITSGEAETSYRRGHYQKSKELYTQVHLICLEQSGDLDVDSSPFGTFRTAAPTALVGMGRSSWALGQTVAAQQQLHQALALIDETHRLPIWGWCHNSLGEIDRGLSRWKEAQAHYQLARKRFQELDDLGPVAIIEQNSALAHLGQGQLAQAAQGLESAFGYWFRCGSQHGLGLSLMGCASYALATESASNCPKSLVFWKTAQRILDGLQCPLDPSDQMEWDRLSLIFEKLRTPELDAMCSALSSEALPEAVTALFSQKPEEAKAAPSAGLVIKGNPEQLTAREREVLSLLAEGLTNPAIAEKLSISRHTVTVHLRTIYEKLGLHNRSEATRWFLLGGKSNA